MQKQLVKPLVQELTNLEPLVMKQAPVELPEEIKVLEEREEAKQQMPAKELSAREIKRREYQKRRKQEKKLKKKQEAE